MSSAGQQHGRRDMVVNGPTTLAADAYRVEYEAKRLRFLQTEQALHHMLVDAAGRRLRTAGDVDRIQAARRQCFEDYDSLTDARRKLVSAILGFGVHDPRLDVPPGE
jgi:hypothetical protein